MADLWSYSTGEWGVNRVRVYERYDGSPLHIEWTGAKGRSLKNVTGKSVRDRDLAKRVANRMSQRLVEANHSSIRSALGIPDRHTVGELLARYHKDMEAEWGAHHRKAQRHLRKWWRTRLGADTDLRSVTEAAVEDVVRREAKRKEWSPRTRQQYLRYIMSAFRYARRKLKWISEADDLTAVDVPTPKRGGPSYTHAEMMRLLKAAPEVDWRVDLALNIAYDAQARSEAVRTLRAEHYQGDGWMRFPAETDKAGKARLAALSATTQWKVEAALRRDVVKASGFLIPGETRPLVYDRLLALLEEVERAAGVPKVERRGWHGVKRRAVTDARRAAGSMGVVSKQSGTREDTLQRIYEQDDPEPKRALAEAMEALRRA